MPKKRARQLATQLLRQLSTKTAAALLGHDRAAISALLAEHAYSRRLEELLSTDGRLTCAAVLEQCRDTLDFLSPQP